MNKPDNDKLPPYSLSDFDDDSPFNVAYEQWRRGKPKLLADYIRINGITRKWEALCVSGLLLNPEKRRLRKNETEKAALLLRHYAELKRTDPDAPTWDTIYGLIAAEARTTPDAVRKLRQRLRKKNKI